MRLSGLSFFRTEMEARKKNRKTFLFIIGVRENVITFVTLKITIIQLLMSSPVAVMADGLKGGGRLNSFRGSTPRSAAEGTNTIPDFIKPCAVTVAGF